MARRRWGEWASARMLRALVREGARVHAAAGVRTVAPPVFLVQCVPGPKSAVAGVPAFFGPIPRVTTPGKRRKLSPQRIVSVSRPSESRYCSEVEIRQQQWSRTA